MSYVSEVLEQLVAKNPGESLFHQAATEVLTTIEPVINSNPAYEKNGVLERLTEPDRVIMFRVPWVDDQGKVRVNKRLPRAVQRRDRPVQGRPAAASRRSTWAW